jgi:hypothetical protein
MNMVRNETDIRTPLEEPDPDKQVEELEQLKREGKHKEAQEKYEEIMRRIRRHTSHPKRG